METTQSTNSPKEGGTGINDLKIDFRIPISPTQSFYSQVRFYNYALRRLGSPYDNARLIVTVGDKCDINQVRRENRWSENFNVVWAGVPDGLFDSFGYAATGNWRLNVLSEDSDVSILADADTVLFKDINPLLAQFPKERPTIFGHMAHFPPPQVQGVPASSGPDFWPWLFDQMGVPRPNAAYRYSMDSQNRLPPSPAYFNYGFVAVNSKALTILGEEMWSCLQHLTKIAPNPMNGQIALTLVSYKHGFDVGVLPAPYNTANDLQHMTLNKVAAEDIRVLHYLRGDEINRSEIVLENRMDAFLSTVLRNPANITLQNLVREYKRKLSSGY